MAPGEIYQGGSPVFLFWASYILLGQLALSVIAQSDNTSSDIGSNKVYVAISQLRGQGWQRLKIPIPALNFTNTEIEEIINISSKYLID